MTTSVPPDVPDTILLELGRVVACGAWLENWLAALAGSLQAAELGQQGSLFSPWAHRPVSQVLDGIFDRSQFADAAEWRVLALLERVRPLLDDRNKVVHGQWGAGEALDGGGVVKFDRSGDVFVGFFEAAELRDLAHQLHEAAEEASELSLAVTPSS